MHLPISNRLVGIHGQTLIAEGDVTVPALWSAL